MAASFVAAFALAGARLAGGDTPALTARPAGQAMLAWAEFGMAEDRIYVAPADRLDDRVLVDTVRHAQGWGINPASEVAGRVIAYTVLPEGSPPQRDAAAELWLLELEGRNKTRLARDADLLITPVFVGDGAGLVYRRSSGSRQQLVHVDVASLSRVTLHEEDTAFGIFPVGLAPDGSFLFTRLSTAGTDLYAVRSGSAPEFVAHLSDDIARDLRLSPDGATLAYLAPVFGQERVAYRAHLLPLAGAPASALPATTDALGEQYGPVWTPRGDGLTVGQEALASAAEPAVVLGMDGSLSPLPAAVQGFDVPLGWSPDGRFLAVRWFDGRGSMQPGMDTTVIVDRGGGRYALQSATEVIYIGWFSGA